MIITCNTPTPDAAPPAPPGTLLAAAIDVEWSNNYQIRGGNMPFCYSVVWLWLCQSDLAPLFYFDLAPPGGVRGAEVLL